MKRTLIVILFLPLFLGCEKNYEETHNLNVNQKEVNVNDGRLNLTHSTFNSLIKDMHKKQTPQIEGALYDKLNRQGFVCLNHAETRSFKAGNNEITIDSLVPDPYFAALLNNEREIVVNDVVYKITEAGTYYTHKNNISKLYNHLESNNLKSQQSMEPIAQSTFRVTEDIYFYDSYRRNEHLEDIYFEDETGGSGGSGSSSSSGSSQNDDSFIPYSDIAWHSFDAKTWAGKAFQSLFGRSRAHNRNFSSKRRIRVNFYSVDFKVYSGIGLNVKYQKKNWIGWSETSCEELIWGWEGIEYEYKLNYSLPYNSTPKRKEYTYVPAVKDKKALTINFLDNEINVPYEKGINASLKYLYNRAEQLLAPEAINIRNQKLAQFREMFPDKVKVVVAPYVEKKYNTKSFSKNFDWSTCEVSLTFGNGNSIKDIVGMKNSASNFDVKKIRVFGIAKRGNEYKGIGIKKDK